MSTLLTKIEEKKLAYKVGVTNPPLAYIQKNSVDRFAIALAIDIPCPLLHFWYGIIGSKDEDGNTFDYLDLLNRWIPNKWFQVSRASGYRIEGRLRREASTFVAKISKAPGSRRKNELNCKTFTLSILVNELVNVGEIERDLNDYQAEVTNVVGEWRQKYSNLENEKNSLLEEILKDLEKKESEIVSLNQDLDCQLEKNEVLEKGDLQVERSLKPLSQLGPRQRLRRIKTIKGKVDVALWFLNSYGLKLSCLKGKQTDSGENVSFHFSDENACHDYDTECTEQVLFLLDKFCGSDEMYHELAMSYDDLPRSYLIKKKRTDLNKLTHVERIPGKYPGAQVPFVNTLTEHVGELLKLNPDYGTEEPIKIKISCDGAKMSRSTNFVILSFSLLQSGTQVMSSKGNRTIAIVNGPEKYETLKSSLGSIINEINNVIDHGKITVAGRDLNVEMFLGGDYKFLLMAMGMKGPTSHYACLWCKVHKLQRWDTTKDLEFYNMGDMKRTLIDIKNSRAKKQFSCCSQTLFNIEPDHVILDELHLMLRITDRLMENLIKEVMERDSDFSKTSQQPKGVYLDTLLKTINSLGISFSIWEKQNVDGNGSGAYDWTSLVGSDKKKLLYLLPEQLETNDILFPETKAMVVQLWRDFGTLYKLINSSFDGNENMVQDVFSKSKQFVELFCSLATSRIGYNKARVTPYMHCLIYHVPMFLLNHKSLKQFTGQGVEKNNDDAKRIFYQKSNKWDAARDVLLHESRQIALQHCERRKRSYDKHSNDYWEHGIVDDRKKRISSKRGNAGQPAELSVPEHDTTSYDNMTVKKLKEQIKSKNIKVKGLAKMKKGQLIDILKSCK